MEAGPQDPVRGANSGLPDIVHGALSRLPGPVGRDSEQCPSCPAREEEPPTTSPHPKEDMMASNPAIAVHDPQIFKHCSRPGIQAPLGGAPRYQDSSPGQVSTWIEEYNRTGGVPRWA